MTKKSPSRIARDEAKAQEHKDAAMKAAANTDFVEEELRKNGHYDNNQSFADLRRLHGGLADAIIGMQAELLREYSVPGLTNCIEQSETGRVKVALGGLSSDFQSFISDLSGIKARYADKADRATNQDEVFLALALTEEYQLLTIRMSEVIRPAYTYLATQAGLARQRLEAIIKPFKEQIAAEDAAANPEVVTDVEAKLV